jgi:hypothetical protein
MNTHVRHLGRGTLCGYCGETSEGEEAKAAKAIVFSDLYFDEEVMVLDPLKSADEQILAFAKEHFPEPEDVIQCPKCGETSLADDEYADIVTGELFQCTDCEEVHPTADDAEACCSYQRDYNERNKEYVARERARMVEDAKRLLADEGYQVLQTSPLSSLQGP